MPTPKRPALTPLKPEKYKLTVVIPHATALKLRQLNDTLRRKGYDTSQARLLTKFIDEGSAKIMEELKIKSLNNPGLKPLPGGGE